MIINKAGGHLEIAIPQYTKISSTYQVKISPAKSIER
jgi:hypothetical protein